MTTLDYRTSVTSLDGRQTDLQPYAGKVLLVVNTASACGLTPQYSGLQALHERYGDQGLAVLGFPCNQFGAQEPGSADEIRSFCTTNYGVTFPMFAKVEVNGAGAHPLFQQLKQAAPAALEDGSISWNFGKFLVGRDGTVLGSYAPGTAPAELAGDIEDALGR